MKIKELLLNGQNFITTMKQFAVDIQDIHIQDEALIEKLAVPSNANEIIKEHICIEGKNKDGIVEFFGTLHYNLMNQLAVFELQGYEQRARSLV